MDQDSDLIYTERISSNKTLALFAALTAIFLLLAAWRAAVTGLDTLAVVFLVFSLFFLFYSVNYRTLVVRLTQESLRLVFGIFTWSVPLDNIAECGLDEVPPLQRYGGAGIHFMFVRGRYRASFNFLDYPRVVIALKKKTGPVQDISFSTRQPDDIMRLVRGAIATK